MKKIYTESMLLRVTKTMKSDIARASKQKKIDKSVFVRGAIEKAMPKWCACGRHWGHTGRHGIN